MFTWHSRAENDLCDLLLLEFMFPGTAVCRPRASDFNLHVYTHDLEEMSHFVQTAHVKTAICCTWLFGKMRIKRQVKINKQYRLSVF